MKYAKLSFVLIIYPKLVQKEDIKYAVNSFFIIICKYIIQIHTIDTHRRNNPLNVLFSQKEDERYKYDFVDDKNFLLLKAT